MKNLKCSVCGGEEFHPIETGTVTQGPSIYNIDFPIAFKPTTRVFVCVGCGHVDKEETEDIDTVKLYVVSNSVSKATKELKSVGIDLTHRELKSLEKMSILVYGDVSIVRNEVLESILQNSPTELAGFDAQYLNRG